MAETLARIHTANAAYPFSLTRNNQALSQLEAFLASVVGYGVISGGGVIKTTGYGLRVLSGAVFAAEGVLLTLSSNQDYNSLTAAAGTYYLWGKVLRTAANPANPTDSDTYTLSVTHGADGSTTPPSSQHFPLAIVTADGSGVTAITDPVGKHLARASAGAVRDWIGPNESVTLPAGYQWRVFGGELRVDGNLTVGGQIRIEA